MRAITDLEELRSIELSILERVDAWCGEHGITYFLAYGTLLGAVRHEGFIPWDDDIDVWMLRKDYDRFVEEFPRQMGDLGLFLNAPSTTRGYNRIFAKVCDSRTVLVEINRDNAFNEGAFIDVFPVDGLPRGRFSEFLRLTELQAHKASLLYAAKKRPAQESSSRIRSMFITLGKPILGAGSVEGETRAYADAGRKSPPDSGGRVCFPMTMGRLGRNGVASFAAFSETVILPFCNHEFPAPIGYDELLRALYGDYMQLPPVEDRVPHHSFDLYWKDGKEPPIGAGMSDVGVDYLRGAR